MNVRIKTGERLSDVLERIVTEQLDLAADALERHDPVQAVYGARKAIKKIRAFLHMVRAAFPKNAFRAQNQSLAQAGHQLSPLRDVHVELRVLGVLTDARVPAARKLRRDLLRQEEPLMREIPSVKRAVGLVLADSRAKLKSWPLDRVTPGVLADGFRRVYKKGRNAFQRVRKNPSPKNLHDWRKAVKALDHGLELMAILASRRFLRKLKRGRELGDVLGQGHDLFMVMQALGGRNGSRPATGCADLRRQITLRRAELRKQAIKLGQKVYQKKPGAIVMRLHREFAQL
jgi:CHAD domain-containing protein